MERSDIRGRSRCFILLVAYARKFYKMGTSRPLNPGQTPGRAVAADNPRGFAMGTLAQKAPEKVQTKSAPAPRAHAEQIREMSPLQRLQRTMGNQGLQRALQAHMRDTKENAAVKPLMRGDAPVGLQPKLT